MCFAVADLMNLVSSVVNTKAVDHGTIDDLQFAPSHDYLHYNCTRYLLRREKERKNYVRNFFTINICSRWRMDEVSFSIYFVGVWKARGIFDVMSQKKSAITSRPHNECNEISWFGFCDSNEWLVAWLEFIFGL